MRAALKVLAMGLALWAGTARAAVNVESLSFDLNALFKLYNTAQQTNGVIKEWPQELKDQAGVVVAFVKNGGAATVQPYFRVSIQETSTSCASPAGPNLILGPVIQLKDSLGPGESRTLNAASFMIPGSNVDGQFCSSFESDLKSKLESFDANKIQDAIKLFNQKDFQVCLQECDAAGTFSTGTRACTSLKLFTANNVVNQTIVAMLIYPHNNVVPNTFPNFIWSPAILSGDVGKSDVYYTVDVMEDGQDAPYWSVDVPQPNAQYYQWTGSDRALVPGKSYCWRVISNIMIGTVKKPVGGNGKGWNIKKCFTVAGDAPERCHYSKEDLDKWLNEHASPEVKAALSGKAIKNILQIENDPVICRLLAGQVKFTSIKVVKQ